MELNDADRYAVFQTAKQLGVDPYSLGALIEFESSFRPNVMGGDGGNYRGLIQFGPGARQEVSLPDRDMTIAEQMPYVKKYFDQRGFKPGMSTTQMYRTVLVGNPGQSGTDSFGTNSDTAAQNMMPGGDLYNVARQRLGMTPEDAEPPVQSPQSPGQVSPEQVGTNLTVNNNYYGPRDEEFNKESLTQNLMNTLLMNTMNQTQSPFRAPSIKDLMKTEGLGGGYLDPTQFMKNYQ